MGYLLDIKNLTLGYGSKIIFSNITAAEQGGTLIALLGSNGRGKSTLLRTIAALEPLYGANGQVLYNGKEAAYLTKEQMSKTVCFVTPLIERTEYLSVKDLVATGSYFRTNWVGSLGREEEQRIEEALAAVGLESFGQRRCKSLSDGEFQRATIAAALVQNSEIILLDEPTAFLDIANKYQITKMLREIAKEQGKLIIFSTHDLQLALQLCNRLWIMGYDGFYCGATQELIDKGVADKIFSIEGVKFNQEKMSFTFE